MLSYMKVLEPRGIRSQLLPFHKQKAQVSEIKQAAVDFGVEDPGSPGITLSNELWEAG